MCASIFIRTPTTEHVTAPPVLILDDPRQIGALFEGWLGPWNHPVCDWVIDAGVERILAVVNDDDPTLDDVTFDVDVHGRAIKQAPYERATE